MGGGGSQPTATTTTQVNYSPEEQAARNAVQSHAAAIFGNSPATTPNPGAPVAPLSADTLMAQQYMRGAVAPVTQTLDTMNQGVRFGMQDILYGQDPTLQNAINASVRPITEAYTDPGGLMSQQRAEMMNNNMYGSTRDMMMSGILGGRYADAVGDTASKLAAASRGDTLNTFSKTMAFAPQALQSSTMPAQMLSAVGQQNEMFTQAQLDKEAQDRLWAINYPWMNLNNYANIVYGGANPGTTSTQTGSPSAQRGNPLGGMLGGAASGAAIGSVVPGIGTAFGAAAGAIIGLLGSQ